MKEYKITKQKKKDAKGGVIFGSAPMSVGMNMNFVRLDADEEPLSEGELANRGLRRNGTKAEIAAAEKELAGLKERAKKEARENRNARLRKLRAAKSGRAI